MGWVGISCGRHFIPGIPLEIQMIDVTSANTTLIAHRFLATKLTSVDESTNPTSLSEVLGFGNFPVYLRVLLVVGFGVAIAFVLAAIWHLIESRTARKLNPPMEGMCANKCANPRPSNDGHTCANCQGPWVEVPRRTELSDDLSELSLEEKLKIIGI